MIRILHIFIVMNRGGSESMIMNYYRNIDHQKIQFDFLTHRPNEIGIFDDEIKKLGGKIYSVKPINIFNPKKYYNELRAFFDSHKEYQIVHSHLNTFSYYPLKIAKEFGIPTRIAHAHTALPKVNFLDLFSYRNISENIKTLIKFQLKKRIHENTTHCFSCGNIAGKWLFGEKVNFTVINNAINSSLFSYNKEISLKYKEDYNCSNKIVVGHIGNFTEPKNYSFIIDVFYELQKINKNAILILIGDGPLRNIIQTKVNQLGIKEKVLFLGVRTDISFLCFMMDFFIFPSLYEGLPVTLIEAQAADLMIFASETITNEVKISNKFEFLSISDCPASWARKIISYYPYNRKDNKELIKKSGFDIVQNALMLQEFYLNPKK